MNDAAVSSFPMPGRLFEVSDERLAADLKKKLRGTHRAPSRRGTPRPPLGSGPKGTARLCTNGVRPPECSPRPLSPGCSANRCGRPGRRPPGGRRTWSPGPAYDRRMAQGTNGGRCFIPNCWPIPTAVTGSWRRFCRRRTGGSCPARSSGFPSPPRCLLWHTEVEAEQLAAPAGLLGIGDDDALVLRRARERLREGCLEIHRELAPEEECRRFHRMLGRLPAPRRPRPRRRPEQAHGPLPALPSARPTS